LRLLVIDSSRILPWLLGHEFPGEGLTVECVQSLGEAELKLVDGPIDAALVSVPPAALPLREFQHACARQEPPVPVLYESCVAERPEDLGLDPGDGYAAILRKPATRADLRAAVEALLDQARRGRAAEAALSGPAPGPPPRPRS
jgi:hypothetical protein